MEKFLKGRKRKMFKIVVIVLIGVVLFFFITRKIKYLIFSLIAVIISMFMGVL